MPFPSGLYVLMCINPLVRDLFPGIPFEVDEVDDDFIVTLHKENGDSKLTEEQLYEMKGK